MAVCSVHQELEDRSLCDGPSLFVEEWYQRCGQLIRVQIDEGIKPSLVAYHRWRETCPPLFLGIRASVGLLRCGMFDSPPRLWRDGDRLWVAPDWGVEPPHPVQVIPVVAHRLLILVTRDLLLVLRESELAEALGEGSPAPVEPAIGGAR